MEKGHLGDQDMLGIFSRTTPYKKEVYIQNRWT